jgi:hypothetical protein
MIRTKPFKKAYRSARVKSKDRKRKQPFRHKFEVTGPVVLRCSHCSCEQLERLIWYEDAIYERQILAVHADPIEVTGPYAVGYVSRHSSRPKGPQTRNNQRIHCLVCGEDTELPDRYVRFVKW